MAHDRVRADPTKVEEMTSWPQPKNLKQLRGFLGITGYYSRFVAHYATIAAPLTELLTKDSFFWSELATTTFEELRHAMMEAPVLKTSRFF